MALCPDVEWHKLRGMRNRLIHEYFDIDSHILWQVATVDIVALRAPLEKALETLTKTPNTTD